MGSRGQHPGRRVEDSFARASSTLGSLGKGAQSVSRCQSQERVEVEGHRSDASGQCQFAKSCALSATTISASKSTRVFAAAHAKIARVAGCNQRVGRCRHG